MKSCSSLLATAAVLGVLCASSVVSAQSGRYTLIPVGEGALRLDTATGAVAFCRERHDGVVCQSVADERTALQSEIDRLLEENRALRAQVQELRRRAEGMPSAPSPQSVGGGQQGHPSTVPQLEEPDVAAAPEAPGGKAEEPRSLLRLPDQNDVRRLVAYLEQVVRRFTSMMEALRQGSQPREQL